jgi:aryl-alcohol dehydrogenase-like predicted oxidoreductase
VILQKLETLPNGLNQEDLSLQIDMLLAGVFHFDRTPRQETWKAAAALVRAGLVETWETGSDEMQYTCTNFRITDLGRKALKSVQDVYPNLTFLPCNRQ